ncbi:hypothetical protein EP47_08815 [Legionella norrlandica]|uniref:Uncharacterized protein n=1 Tax=Legionella norrlandica TaxID=1498499 RepID=A0A0A2T419_9GAMM|nr:hypothetical protein [Legionella norrlandica]KGP62173.1 hypothetical protein EP47_08815 [Legionella norrlandica]
MSLNFNSDNHPSIDIRAFKTWNAILWQLAFQFHQHAEEILVKLKEYPGITSVNGEPTAQEVKFTRSTFN